QDTSTELILTTELSLVGGQGEAVAGLGSVTSDQLLVSIKRLFSYRVGLCPPFLLGEPRSQRSADVSQGFQIFRPVRILVRQRAEDLDGLVERRLGVLRMAQPELQPRQA